MGNNMTASDEFQRAVFRELEQWDSKNPNSPAFTIEIAQHMASLPEYNCLIWKIRENSRLFIERKIEYIISTIFLLYR